MKLADIKNYMRIDDDCTEDDALITALISGATEYIQNQTGKAYQANDEVWNICVKMMVAHWYENRTINPNKIGVLTEFPHSVTALIQHIAICSKYPAEVAVI